ncbi:VIT domain-containing protein [Zavarzinella formosa]|uniref:VIT domain-containing protein n=1 Tax=Zavarzinella formosa TaxID=360055 RepID=UPI0002DE1945|nr:VIT domain-containing protein [Zavarzinella formosa]
MTTEQAIELLSASIDRALTPAEQTALESWLAADPEHRALADGLRQQHTDLKTTFEPRREAVAQVISQVTQTLPVTTPPPSPPARPDKPRWQRLANPFTGAVAAALVVGLGLYVFKARNPSQNLIPNADRAPTEVALNIGMKPRAKPAGPEAKKLVVGDKVVTVAGEKRRVTLPDDSIVYVNQGTTVELTSDRHLKLTAGDVFIEAVPTEVAKTKFVVETPARSVTALGTKFAVTAANAGTGVIVTQGKVEVSDIAEPVASGQQLQPNDLKPTQAPRGACAVEWTRELIVAAEAPLVPAGKHSGGSLVAVDPYGQEAKLSLVKFHIDVHVEDGFARTTIDQTFFNNENQQLEGTFYFPLPPDASLNRLAMYVDGNRMEGGMAERDHARNVYETIRHQRRDPALLEWIDGSVFKMRVFPLPAREEKRIVLSYTQKLNATYGRSTYRFPSGHSLSHVEQWSFNATLKNAEDWSVASPSHPAMKVTPQGKDILLTDKAANIRIDRDVVLEMADHQEAAKQPGTTQWSQFTQDGQRYMMLRYKPDLPQAQRRERRDWVFLFESSGARDPLVARTQVEVIRTLLNHAEHEDTFTILTVGTRVRAFTPPPGLPQGENEPHNYYFRNPYGSLVPATGENAAKAIQWLEQAHLIGALNLEEAFTQAGRYLKDARNPHIVHVGGGIASYGEQRPEPLMKLLPAGSRYVGVAVGKRFSTTLMKTAAEKTGGVFTQINPDEPVAWRGFELASVLNAPRLLNVKLDVPGQGEVRFLPFTGSVAHGEELVAVARATNVQPALVKITGSLDGVTYEKNLVPGNFTEGAGHLPRSWAKLEIDRLLAENNGQHQHTITELSKAMYVMTPYTSLLVLENEQMYKDFNVDRGRKDHWAMYPAPDKIPVVYIPDPNNPWATRGSIIGQKPHENQVLTSIFCRQPAMVLQGPNLPGHQPVVQNAAQRYGAAVAIPDEVLTNLGDMNEVNDLFFDLPNEDTGLDSMVRSHLEFETLGELERQKVRLLSLATDGAKEMDDKKKRYRLPGVLRSSDRYVNQGLSFSAQPNNGPKQLEQITRLRMEKQVTFNWSDMDGEGLRSQNSRRHFYGNYQPFRISGHGNQSQAMFDDLISIDGKENLQRRPQELRELSKNLKDLQVDFSARSALGRSGMGWDALPRPAGLDGTNLFNGRMLELSGDMDQPVPNWHFSSRSELAAVKLPEPIPSPEYRKREQAARFDGFQNARFGFNVSAPAYYQRPGFVFTERLFRDLPSFAPGLSSLPADVKAVVEAEAAPRFGLKRGTVDPGAKKLFDAARANMGWRTTLVPQPDGTKLRVTHDGLGRYAYERTVSFGLKEYVLCDGKTLWHSYPEIGLGAKRTVSRFHRAAFLELIPEALPPADDLNYGADVKLVAPNKVAVIPHHQPDEDGNVPPWAEAHYVFADGRLVETFAMRQPEAKSSARLVFDAKGSLVIIGTDAKMLASAKVEREPAKEPSLTPDNKALVVLPLPLRSRDIVFPQIGLDANHSPQESRACLSDDAMLELLACEWGMGSGEIANIVHLMKHDRGDRRPGLDVLLATLNYSPQLENRDSDEAEALIQRDPLTRYLYREFDNDMREWNKKFGFGLPAEQKTDFLSRLGLLRVMYDRFTGPYVSHPWWGIRDTEVKRALKYVGQHADSVLGWAALGIISDVGSPLELQGLKADAWGVMAEKSRFPYAARYEQARLLDSAGRGKEAMKKFQDLFREALSVGVLPTVDDRFRTVLSSYDQGDWPGLMKEMAAKCVGIKARPVVVLLAWQCWQLGDVALSDTILDAALKGASEEETPVANLWAVQFLTATNRHDRADALLQPLLTNKRTIKAPPVWRLASQVAASRGDQVRSIEYLEAALDIEFTRLPDSFDVNPIRQDYSQLLAHYEWLADAATKLNVPTPKNLPTRLVKAVDRWRQMDPEAESICQRSGVVLRKIGSEEATALAWDYETTPLALKPNESGPWESLAHRLRMEGDWKLADRAYEMAYLAEPTNAQLLWNRAQHLKDKGQIAESRAVFKKLADGNWQERFRGLAMMAKAASMGQ